MEIRNIGIFAHVDAGKTTLSEQLLVHAGAVRKGGSVDSGTAHTDNLPVERRRGISVKATCVQLSWKGTVIHLIDTPGHVDFSAEIERSLWALDGAVLVICGVEGVQPQTEVLFRALREARIPTLLFINKCDRENANVARVMQEISRRLTKNAALLSDADSLCETVCALDDDLMEQYLSGQTPDRETLLSRLAALSRAGEACPVLCGSALKDQGILAVLDAVVDFLPPPDAHETALCGVAFAVSQDKTLGRGVWVRLFGGRLENRAAITLPRGVDPITGEKRTVQQKITQIRGVDGEDRGDLTAGEIGVVYGLTDMGVGFVLGDKEKLPRRVEMGRLRTPLMTVQVIPESMEDMTALRAACRQLSGEDPLLRSRYSPALETLHVQVMGMIQLEILQESLESRFGLRVRFSEPSVIYRETLAREAVGFAAYTMPKPCWAILKFKMEPGERGSGVVFSSQVPGKDILPRYQHQVEQALPIALNQGRLGWQVTDVRITLIGGSHHQFHTHPLDFIVATPWAIQDGLQRGGSVLLEPILKISFLLPPECLGRVMSDVNRMRGEVTETVTEEDRVLLSALVPAKTSMRYAADLAALTGGRGSMSVALHGYRECPLDQGGTAQRRGVDPLDTARYILAARSALEGEIFGVDGENEIY